MKEQLQRYKQYLLTGVSHVIPFIASGGILIALAVAFAPMTSQGPSFAGSPLLKLIVGALMFEVVGVPLANAMVFLADWLKGMGTANAAVLGAVLGAMGIENELSAHDIKAADRVLMAIDIVIEGEECFENQRVLKVPIQDVLKDPKAVFKRLEG